MAQRPDGEAAHHLGVRFSPYLISPFLTLLRYKILFLDVLFPLNVKKIIYVDADQVVRADLKELRDMDLKVPLPFLPLHPSMVTSSLQGAPYGYTPFCSGPDMNPTTKGFRFWAGGYWEGHLQGRPYHISALYVVDVDRLRREGVADNIRATYDSLSRDPGSLANLDQDLPNVLQYDFSPPFVVVI